jgi:dienelactone hydrolase
MRYIMKRANVLVAVMAALLFVNCQSEGRSGGEAKSGVSVTERGTSAGNRGVNAVNRGANAAAALQAGSEEVRFTTSDGVVITGTLYAAGGKPPAVLCLHQWRSDRGSFAALAKSMQAAGMTVLAIDMRGYGGSTKTTAGKSIRPDRRAGEDIKAAMQFLRSHKSVDPARIGIVGASYGSSNAIIHAAGDAAVRAVVLLSPGLNYFNELPTEEPVRRYRGRPMLVVSSDEDLRSVETIEAYRKIDAGMEVKMYPNAGHGTDILDAGVGLDAVIISFLKKNL